MQSPVVGAGKGNEDHTRVAVDDAKAPGRGAGARGGRTVKKRA